MKYLKIISFAFFICVITTLLLNFLFSFLSLPTNIKDITKESSNIPPIIIIHNDKNIAENKLELITPKSVEISEESKFKQPVQDNHYTSDEHLLARLIIAESEDQSDYGKRLVASAVLNRLDTGKYGNTLKEVIYSEGQFTCISDGRFEKVTLKEEDFKLAREEILSRTDNQVQHFRTDHFHDFGTAYIIEGDHYFSK